MCVNEAAIPAICKTPLMNQVQPWQNADKSASDGSHSHARYRKCDTFMGEWRSMLPLLQSGSDWSDRSKSDDKFVRLVNCDSMHSVNPLDHYQNSKHSRRPGRLTAEDHWPNKRNGRGLHLWSWCHFSHRKHYYKRCHWHWPERDYENGMTEQKNNHFKSVNSSLNFFSIFRVFNIYSYLSWSFAHLFCFFLCGIRTMYIRLLYLLMHAFSFSAHSNYK